MPMLSRMIVAAMLACAAQAAFAATPQPVRTIPVYVNPYYQAPRSADGRPRVEVGRSFDHPLQSSDPKDIAAVRDRIAADPAVVTPMTMMVLAIRLYDTGLRDDAVFWYYVARARYITLEDTIDVSGPGLASASTAEKNFARLAGPYFNSYAFCDRARQDATLARALDWVEQHPYGVIFLDSAPAKPGDRKANLAQSIKRQRASAEAERAKFNDPKFAAKFAKARAKNKTDTMFCWK
jgi:hypothetical protein